MRRKYGTLAIREHLPDNQMTTIGFLRQSPTLILRLIIRVFVIDITWTEASKLDHWPMNSPSLYLKESPEYNVPRKIQSDIIIISRINTHA